MVSVILDCLAEGMTNAEVLAEYPELKQQDVAAALAYASRAVKVEEEIELAVQAG
jgi:uncharacterized protein (DUF433 family)